MPVQVLIRKLTRPQVEKAIADSKQKLVIQDYEGQLLLIVANQAEGGDPAANKALQAIANMDAAIMHKEQTEAKAAAAAAAKP